MYKYIFIIGLIIIVSNCSLAQTNDYKSIHKGKFYNKYKPESIIKRTLKRQVEKNTKENYKLIFKIKWINENKYLMIFQKATTTEDLGCLEEGFTILVTVTEVTENSYKWDAYNDKCGGAQKGEFIILDKNRKQE